MEILKNQEALQEAVRTHRLVIVQFGAGHCAPCRALQNRIQSWNRSHPEVCHLYVDVADFPETCAQMGVFTVPAVFIYAEGKLTVQQSGYFSLDQMLQQAEKYRRLLE